MIFPLNKYKNIKYIKIKHLEKWNLRKIYFASVNNVAPTNLVDKTITSSIINPIGLVIIPFVSESGTTGSLSAGALGFAQYESSWDTAPSTYAPLSLTNLSVYLGVRRWLMKFLTIPTKTFYIRCL